jgi:polyisoprenoid-binding protein YceI
VRFAPDDPRATTIRIRILADSLKVLTPPDTAEIRKVTASMRDEVMHVTQYPEISFVSKSVTPVVDGYRVVADLAMHGQTREVQVLVKVEVRGDTLRARSDFALKQTDFGIRPYRGGPAGTVRVADKVEFRIDAVAVRRAD